MLLEDASLPTGAVQIADLNSDGHADVVIGWYESGPSPGDINADGFPGTATARSGAPNILCFSGK